MDFYTGTHFRQGGCLRFFSCYLVAVFLGGGLAGCSYPVHTSGSVDIVGEDARLHVSFNERDRRLIHDYYRSHAKRLPPGLAKKGKVPPGHMKKLARYHKLPSGYSGRALPWELHRRLSPLPRDYVRLQIGSDIVLLDALSRVVVDIIYDID